MMGHFPDQFSLSLVVAPIMSTSHFPVNFYQMLRCKTRKSLNEFVYKFKRYEDSSLVYTGINKHEGEDIGLYDTVLSRRDYEATFVNEPVEIYEIQ
jgi:hypothetical protein